MAVYARKLVDSGTGIEIGKQTADTIGFYGTTPVDQGAAVTLPTNEATNVIAITALVARLEDLGIIAAN